MSSTVYTDFLTTDEVNSILLYYSDKPDAQSERNIVNKNLEYHIPDNFIYKLLNPKISKIIGVDHEFDGGAYKECHVAYPLHVDTASAHYEIGATLLGQGSKKHDISILVPLVEGSEFKTVTFNVFSDDNHTNLLAYTQADNNELLAEDFSHDRFNLIQKLPVDTVFEWKLGNILIWPRNQWHASTNFAVHGSIKKFLVLFIK